MCSSDFKSKQTRFSATVPLFTRVDFSCWGIRSLSMWQYFTHSTTSWTLFTALTAGFVNFSNRISPLLFVPPALTSSSRRGICSLNVIMTKQTSDRQEWMPRVPRFPRLSPFNLCLDKCGKWLQEDRILPLLWPQCCSVVLVLNIHIIFQEERADNLQQTVDFVRQDIRATSHIVCPFSGFASRLFLPPPTPPIFLPGCFLSGPMREALWGRLSSFVSCHLMEKKSTRTVQRSSSSPRHKTKYAQ